MTIYINKIKSLHNLLALPNECLFILLKFMICLVLFMVIFFIAINISSSREDKINGLLSLYLKFLSMVINIIFLFILFFLVMKFLFCITIDTIIDLYNCHITKDLFKALVGPTITILTISLSAFGILWSKSLLQDFFDKIQSWIKVKLPRYLKNISKKIKSSVRLFSIITILLLGVFIWLLYKFFYVKNC